MIEKLKNKKSIVLLLLFIFLILSINTIISYFLEQKLSEFLFKNNTNHYTATVENVNFKLFSSSVQIENFILNPTSEFYEDVKMRHTKDNELTKINITWIKLKKLGEMKANLEDFDDET